MSGTMIELDGTLQLEKFGNIRKINLPLTKVWVLASPEQYLEDMDFFCHISDDFYLCFSLEAFWLDLLQMMQEGDNREKILGLDGAGVVSFLRKTGESDYSVITQSGFTKDIYTLGLRAYGTKALQLGSLKIEDEDGFTVWLTLPFSSIYDLAMLINEKKKEVS